MVFECVLTSYLTYLLNLLTYLLTYLIVCSPDPASRYNSI